MASKANKGKAQKLVDEARQLLNKNQSEQEKKPLAQQVIALMDEAITLDESNDNAWCCRGEAKHDLGDHQGAIMDCSIAIALNPRNAVAFNNRAAAKNNSGDYQGAIEDANNALKLENKYDKALINRGVGKTGLNKYQDAIVDYDKAIRFDPQNANAWNNKGWAKYKLGEYEEALKDYDEALRLNPDDKLFRNNRLAADVAYKRGEKAKKLIAEKDNIIITLENKRDYQRRLCILLSIVRGILLLILFAIIVSFFLLIFGFIECLGWLPCFSGDGIFNKLTKQIDVSNPLSFFPVFSILGFIIMPIIWGLRITGQAIMQASILEQDYFSRLNVMNSLDYYESELGKDRNDLIIDHIKNWMNDNTADRMERLYSKKSDAGKTPHEDVMKLCEQMIDKRMKKAGNTTNPSTKK